LFNLNFLHHIFSTDNIPLVGNAERTVGYIAFQLPNQPLMI